MFINNLWSAFSTRPEHIAIRSSNGNLTYRDAKHLTIRLAKKLKTRGIGKGDLVAVCGPRSPELLLSMIGTMFSGAAYTVIETDDLASETIRRLKEIDPDFVVFSSNLAHAKNATNHPSIIFDHNYDTPCGDGEFNFENISDDDVAYVLFTSGSTGHPKGVLVTHGNITHYCTGISEKLSLHGQLTFGHVSAFSADLGNTSIFLALWTGGALYLADEFERKDPLALANALVNHRVDVLKITPTHWRSIFPAILDAMCGEKLLDTLILGGEQLHAGLAMAILDSNLTSRLVNHYGPTETTIGVLINIITPKTLTATSKIEPIPIGRPFGKTTILVRSDEGQIESCGSEGELLIGGPSVSRGYLNELEMTKDRFVSLGDDESIYYKTGDRVRISNDGEVTFIGRNDRQVKIKGYRVELEQVEHYVHQINSIKKAHVVHHRAEDRDHLLCAYEGEETRDDLLISAMLEHAPQYMVPTKWIHFSSLPINRNGKIDSRSLQRSLVEVFKENESLNIENRNMALNTNQDLEGKLVSLFSRFNKSNNISIDDNFFDGGADSLDAIQLISELQLQRFPVSAKEFLSNPTIRSLMRVIQEKSTINIADSHEVLGKTKHYSCSPAQRWFFDQDFAEPNRWTQAMLLEVGITLNADNVKEAAYKVVAEHPLLRSRFFQNLENGQWMFESTDGHEDIFTAFTVEQDVAELSETLVADRYHQLEDKISIADGRVFQMELIAVNKSQYLLIAAHHLVIDVVSWRILLDDLMRHYHHIQAKQISGITNFSAHFGDWVEHLLMNRNQLEADLTYWGSNPKAVLNDHAPRIDSGIERDSRTTWLNFTHEETTQLAQAAAAAGTTMDRFLLAKFIEQCKNAWPCLPAAVQVESHGRICLSDDIDVSRTSGWFTSAFPLTFTEEEIRRQDFTDIIHTRLNAIPNHGHAYSFIEHDRSAHPPFCFNFLGQSRLGLRDDWKLQPASIQLPSVRGSKNSRVYFLKFTGRLIDNQLTIDFNFDSKSVEPSDIENLCRGFKDRLGLADKSAGDTNDSLFTLQGNSAGALWNAPKPLRCKHAHVVSYSKYKSILITGSTGFIGIYVLRELLLNTRSHIYCLIRATNATTARSRLDKAWSNFFGHLELATQLHRITVIVGDISKQNLGMSPAEWEEIACSVDAVYHFAADTRLVGSRADMEANVLFSTEEIIRLSEDRKIKDIHYMSTLAVCGASKGSIDIEFDENSLDIGQTFLNEYERNKFKAECLLRDFYYRGKSAYIYRSGNVTGDSSSGAFQCNASSNRWVQCLRAIAVAGKAPKDFDEKLILSPVDIVANGIVNLSLSPALKGGTFHVDSPHVVRAGQFVESLRTIGIPIVEVEEYSLDAALRRSNNADRPEVVLGIFWSTRDKRNVKYNNTKTLEILAKQGITFPVISKPWIQQFVSRLHQAGALDAREPAQLLTR